VSLTGRPSPQFSPSPGTPSPAGVTADGPGAPPKGTLAIPTLVMRRQVQPAVPHHPTLRANINGIGPLGPIRTDETPQPARARKECYLYSVDS